MTLRNVTAVTQHFYSTYSICGELTLSKQEPVESKVVVSCVVPLSCLVNQLC